jgi:hypothetical protein
MKKQTVFISFFILLIFNICGAQTFFRTADLFRNTGTSSDSGALNIIQSLSVDTLISRYVMANKLMDSHMEGFRIQIFRSSNRGAREESNKVMAEFVINFPDITPYQKYAEPGYFVVRAGDFRTRVEGSKSLYQIRKKYPNAYLVPDIINFPDLNKK